MVFPTEIHSKLQERSDTFSSNLEEGSIIWIPLTVGGNLCLGFGDPGGSLARPAVSRLLKLHGSLHECPDTAPLYGKAFPTTTNVCVQIHQRTCLSQDRKQKLSCAVSLLCRKLMPRG